jgi:hypothetical protein
MLRPLQIDRNDAERRADRAELQLEMARMTRRQYASCSLRQDHRRRRMRRETRYRDGGASVMWVTPSDEEDELMHQGGNPDPDIISQTYLDESPRRTVSTPRAQLSHAAGRDHINLPRRPSPFRSAMSGLNRPLAERLPERVEHSLEDRNNTPSRPSTSVIASTSHVQGRVDVSITPSRAHGHGVSVVVTPRHQHSADGHLSDPEPLSGWEGSSPPSRQTA